MLFILVAFATACASNSTEKSTTDSVGSNKKDQLEIYAFHGTRQCTTCKNMKAFTKSTLNKYFKQELNEGLISFSIIDVDDETNYELAEKFEATGTALMVNNRKNGKDHIKDWSDFAFEYANGDQKTFELKLKTMIGKELK